MVRYLSKPFEGQECQSHDAMVATVAAIEPGAELFQSESQGALGPRPPHVSGPALWTHTLTGRPCAGDPQQSMVGLSCLCLPEVRLRRRRMVAPATDRLRQFQLYQR